MSSATLRLFAPAQPTRPASNIAMAKRAFARLTAADRRLFLAWLGRGPLARTARRLLRVCAAA